MFPVAAWLLLQQVILNGARRRSNEYQERMKRRADELEEQAISQIDVSDTDLLDTEDDWS